MRRTDDAKASFVSSTASDRKGLVKGEPVPLDCVLPTFAQGKVGPRRAGVQSIPSGQSLPLCIYLLFPIAPNKKGAFQLLFYLVRAVGLEPTRLPTGS